MGVPIYVTSPEKVPQQPHYAIFKFFSVSQSLYSENDSTTSGCTYEAYVDKNDWVREIEHLEKQRGYDRTRYVAVKVGAPAKPVTKIEVSVDE